MMKSENTSSKFYDSFITSKTKLQESLSIKGVSHYILFGF